MIKRIIKKSGIGKILLFAVLVLAMATAAEPVLRPSSVRSCTNAVSAFRKLPENSIDVIAFGSSRVWRGINTPILCDEFGFSAYNFGTNWQKLNTTELYVEEALKTQLQQPRCLPTSRQQALPTSPCSYIIRFRCTKTCSPDSLLRPQNMTIFLKTGS